MNKTELIVYSMLKEETLSEKFVKKWFWLYLFTFLGAPLGYIIKIALARDLSMHDFGLFYGIISLITLLSAFNDLGGTESLNYFLPKYIIEKKYEKVKYLLRFVLGLQLVSSFLIIAILWYFGREISLYHFRDIAALEIIYIISLFFLGTNLLHICTALFSATQNTKLQKSVDFVRMFSTMIFTLAVFFLDFWSLKIYTWTWISGLGVAILYALYYFYKEYYRVYLKWVRIEVDPELRKRFIKYAIPTFLTANIGVLLSQIDAQLVTRILWNEAQALYSNYLSIMTLPFFVLSPMIAFLFPVFTELFARNNIAKISFLYKNIMLYLIILSIWVTAFLFQTGESLARILFGEMYRESGLILQFSIPFLIFNLLNQLNFQVLAGTGKAWARTVSFAVALPINIALNLYLIPKYGVEWSALAVWLSWIPLYLMTLYSTRAYFAFPNAKPIVLNISVALLAFLAYYAIDVYGNIQASWLALIIAIVIYALLFFSTNFSLFREALKIIKHNRS